MTTGSPHSSRPGRADLPLTVEFQDPSWHVDEVFAALRDAGAALCTTELPEDDEPPTIRRTGSVPVPPAPPPRLQPADWPLGRRGSSRSSTDGIDAFVFFRHDDVGRGAELPSSSPALTARSSRPGLAILRPDRRRRTACSSSVMSWNRCGTFAATKTTVPARMSRTSSPTVIRPAPGDDVVDLVLAVRPLEIRLAGRQDVQADAQVRDGDELEVGSPGGLRGGPLDRRVRGRPLTQPSSREPTGAGGRRMTR